MGKHSSNFTTSSLPKEVRPISSWGYVGYSILYAIPVIGWLFLILFSFSRNKNRRNFARSYWCCLLLFLIFVVLCALGYVVFREQINERITNAITQARAKANELDLSWFTHDAAAREYPELTEEETPPETEIPNAEEAPAEEIAGTPAEESTEDTQDIIAP